MNLSRLICFIAGHRRILLMDEEHAKPIEVYCGRCQRELSND